MMRDGEQLDVIDPTPGDLESFGLDPDGPVPEEYQEVTVPETLCPLSDQEMTHFLDEISHLQDDHDPDFGIRRFCAAKQLLNEILQYHDTGSSSDSGE